MTINKIKDGSKMTIALDGKLDSKTSPVLEAELKTSLDGITELIMDFKDLAYISSAGMRVLLTAHKTMEQQGRMVVRNVNEEIDEVFEITGFCDKLNIEK